MMIYFCMYGLFVYFLKYFINKIVYEIDKFIKKLIF